MTPSWSERPAGTADLAAAQALLLEEALSVHAQTMQREGRSPEEIMGALWDENNRHPSPLNEEKLDALVERCVADYRKAYAPRLIKVPMRGFMKTVYPPPLFVVEHLIPRNEITLAGGHGGSGKSILFLALAAHVASGQAWGSFHVEKCRVLFVSLEDPVGHVMHRLQKVINTYLLDPSEVEGNLQVVDGTRDPELMIECNEYGAHRLLPTQTLHEIETEAVGAGLIIIDNASDAFGGNENARREVRAFIRELGRIARSNDAGLILLAHIDKVAARYGGGGNSYSGSTAWHNSTRSRLALLEVDGQLQLQHEKHNRSRRSEPVPLVWTEDGVLVPGNSSDAAAARDQRTKKDEEAALIAMREASIAGVRVTAAASGPATSWHAIRHLPEMQAFAGADGRRRFLSALASLQRTGHLKRVAFRDAYRKERVAWELTDTDSEAAGSRTEV